MYAPTLQGTSSNAGSLQCIVALAILAVVWIVLANLASKTRNASPYSRTVAVSLSREQIIRLVEGSFGRSLLSREFNWKSSWPASDRFTLSGYYLTNGQGCLVMLFTGLIPGYLLIKYAMGPSERVTLDFSKFQNTGELTLEALGLRAQREVDNLIHQLEPKA
jgi:hypothetical protein